MISFAEAQENARKHGHVDENGNVWLDTDIFTEIDTRIAFEEAGETLAAFIAESERLANARLEKAV